MIEPYWDLKEPGAMLTYARRVVAVPVQIGVVAAALAMPAHACNHANPNPLDTTCRVRDFMGPINTVPWFASSRIDRQSLLATCQNPNPALRPDRTSCANAAAAERLGGH